MLPYMAADLLIIIVTIIHMSKNETAHWEV